MAFDVCDHKIRQLVIRAAQIFRSLKGLPEEKNITILFNEAAPLFGIPSDSIPSSRADHLPTPAETVPPDSPLLRICPRCKQKSFLLNSYCPKCPEFTEQGYRSFFECMKCGYKENSTDPVVVWLEKLGVQFTNQSKQSLGLKTKTPDGIR